MARLRARLSVRALAGVAAGLVASPLACGNAVVAHAASTWTCEAPMAWDAADSLLPTAISGLTYFAGPSLCGTANTSPISVGLPTTPTFSVGYTYTGNCVLGILSFSNGTIGVFAGGVIVGAQVSLSGAGTFAGAGEPLGIPCLGAQGSTIIWAGAGVEAGVAGV
jgi:hypothetical protein